MDSFFNFLETQAAAELESRRRLSAMQAEATLTAAQNAGQLYREGQMTASTLPSWAIPAMIAGAGLALILVLQK